MARMNISGFGNVEKMLNQLKQPEKMAIRAVGEARPIVEKALKSQIRAVSTRTYKNGKKYSTGGLAESIESTPVKKNNLGVYSVVKPEGENERGLRYVEEMAYLEYGVRSHGQEPRPVRAAAVAQSENAVMQVMEEVIGAEVDKL